MLHHVEHGWAMLQMLDFNICLKNERDGAVFKCKGNIFHFFDAQVSKRLSPYFVFVLLTVRRLDVTDLNYLDGIY